ncbi:uncharacterized protein LOC112692630 [Sipha flava]|uniref:Uncharacterized protein LOC112692630 n=1 Tax=Sipha flava TaxID=143950 RepID=A0A8B8GIS6_9HEMI|nr:uncharacterized protein LOC112692630 [Sipha flava]
MENLRSTGTVFAIVMITVLLFARQSSARPQPDEVEDMKKALYSACSGKSPITEEMKSNAKNGIFSEERNFKCFLMCTFEELSLIDEEGVIDGEAMESMVIDDIKPMIKEAVKSCLPDIAGKPDPCEVAFNFVKCGANINAKLIEMLPL